MSSFGEGIQITPLQLAALARRLPMVAHFIICSIRTRRKKRTHFSRA